MEGNSITTILAACEFASISGWWGKIVNVDSENVLAPDEAGGG
jgi:hypothetical protein